MEYKVGDKVRVRKWDDMEKEFGTNGRSIITPGCYFVDNTCISVRMWILFYTD